MNKEELEMSLENAEDYAKRLGKEIELLIDKTKSVALWIKTNDFLMKKLKVELNKIERKKKK